MKGTIRLLASNTVLIKQNDGLLTLSLPKGDEAILYSGTKPISFAIEPLQFKQEDCNSWGIRSK